MKLKISGAARTQETLNKKCVATHHCDVPGANLCKVPHQVLPRQQTLHVDIQRLPHGHHLLMTCFQTGRRR